MSLKTLPSFEETAESRLFFLDLESRPDWNDVFQNDRPLKLEIGFGYGSFLMEMAIREPENNFIGIEMFHKGIRKVVARAERLLLKNIRIVYGDAREKVPLIFNDNELREVYVNFPDPWPKKRHAKRRLISPRFARELASKLERNGALRLATDSESYAEHMLTCCEAERGLRNKSGRLTFLDTRDSVPKSKYEKNFLRTGEKIFYLDFVKE
ncbi:MAG: tRNA (guanosine(46)-N7)-methyltransferase TrmB [Nitrospinales bacterium]